MYVDSKNDKLKIGCLVCNSSVLCDDVEGYSSIKEALADTMRWVGIVRRVAHAALLWLEEPNYDSMSH